VVKALKQAQ